MSIAHELEHSIRDLTESINSYGIKLDDPSLLASPRVLKALEKIKEEDLEQIRLSLEGYHSIIKEGPIPGESQCDRNKRHLHSFLDKHGLKTSERILNDMVDHHIVEIHSLSHKQIFRTVNFYSLCSYDLGSLTFIPWDELFYRPEEIVEKIFSLIDSVLQNRVEYMVTNVPKHPVLELGPNQKVNYEMLRIGCVFDVFTKQPMGYLTIISVSRLKGNLKLVQ